MFCSPISEFCSVDLLNRHSEWIFLARGLLIIMANDEALFSNVPCFTGLHLEVSSV